MAMKPNRISVDQLPDPYSTACDVEYLLRTHSEPLLPPNPHFFCCRQRLHITKAAKWLSLFYVFIYFLGCCVVYVSGISITVIFAVLFSASVSLSTVYGTFEWKKLCLIPFFLLQSMLIIYNAVFICVLTYAGLVSKRTSGLGSIRRSFETLPGRSSDFWLVGIIVVLVCLEIFFLYSCKIMLYEYEFIDAVDHLLKSVQNHPVTPPSNGRDQFRDPTFLSPPPTAPSSARSCAPTFGINTGHPTVRFPEDIA